MGVGTIILSLDSNYGCLANRSAVGFFTTHVSIVTSNRLWLVFNCLWHPTSNSLRKRSKIEPAAGEEGRRVSEEKVKARDDEQGVIEGTGEAVKIHLKESIETLMHSTDVRTLLGDWLIDKGSPRNLCVLPALSVLISSLNWFQSVSATRGKEAIDNFDNLKCRWSWRISHYNAKSTRMYGLWCATGGWHPNIDLGIHPNFGISLSSTVEEALEIVNNTAVYVWTVSSKPTIL